MRVAAMRRTAALGLLVSALACSADRSPAPDPRASGESGFTSEEARTGGAPSFFPPSRRLEDRPLPIPAGPLAVTLGAEALVLNGYRGLLRVDLSGPQPRQTARLSLIGQPVALFLAGGTAYALVSDTFTEQSCPSCPPTGHRRRS